MTAAQSKLTQLKRCYATLQLGVAKADGRLTLTDNLLHFEALNKQLNLGSYAIKLNNISRVEKCSGKAGGLIPITTAGIKIITKENHHLEFILAEPDEWLNCLQASH
ncbi:GRAM domain-containing protein [Pseudoalteromonas neustonica]|uniref:GRAM domain-containing protein n=1 Tax=Pseudoalteromonas neustonica TaxID=1840331 RepID=UPI0007DB1FFC|nr:GRAM domain-containing protein [Pseudoalteromonas neustonica]